MPERSQLLKRGAAEFLVIVTGILAAFYVDEYREARGTAALERETFALLIANGITGVRALGADCWAPKDEGTTFRAELLNGVVDLVPLAVAGWLIGVAIGRDVPRSEHRMTKPWLATLLVAFGFVAVHALGATLLDDLVGPASNLLFVPTNPLQIALLAGLGLWVGGMYVVLRAGLPFESTWARVAFFAFGVFGFSWTWFHLFLVIIDLAGLLHVGLLVGLLGAVGVFAGARAYEWLTRLIPR